MTCGHSASTTIVHEYMNDRITIEYVMLKAAYKGHEMAAATDRRYGLTQN